MRKRITAAVVMTGLVAGAANAATWYVDAGRPDGTDNIEADPLFVDMAAGDFRLQAGSPCMDTGNNALVDRNRQKRRMCNLSLF